MLYHITAGENCVLTTACILEEEAYNAEGVTQTDVTFFALPKQDFDKLVAEEETFWKFVFAAYSRRLIDLLRVVDDVAFGRMDIRLAERLLSFVEESNDIQTTHQLLASELGTAREVISRVLNDFQKRNMILQPRDRITLLDKTSLQKLCTPS